MNVGSRARWCLGLFALVLGVSSLFVLTRRQITLGLTEDHFEIGRRLATSGDPLPMFRPPGYPVFVAGVVWLFAQADGGSFDVQVRAVQVAQCVLLAGSSVLLFLWMSQRFGLASSWILALLFAVNPLMLVLAGYLHYDVLHLFCAILACYVASAGIRSHRRWPRAGLTFAGGVLFGVASLVRPVTLPLPLFVAPALLVAFRPRWRLALAMAALFVLGMAAAVFPVALRNYKTTGKIIPVNAQGRIALWAATVEPRQALDNASVPWNAIWSAEGMRIFHEVVGQPEYSYGLLKERILDLEHEFGEEALHNIVRRPHVYARNVARNGWFFLTGAPTGMVAGYLERQALDDRDGRRGAGLQGWLLPGVELMFAAWLVLAFVGSGLATRQKDAFLLLPAAVLLCLCSAHAATYVDFRYLYIKVPFFLLGCAYVTETPRKVRMPFASHGASVGSALRVALLALGIGTSTLLYYATS